MVSLVCLSQKEGDRVPKAGSSCLLLLCFVPRTHSGPGGLMAPPPELDQPGPTLWGLGPGSLPEARGPGEEGGHLDK